VGRLTGDAPRSNVLPEMETPDERRKVVLASAIEIRDSAHDSSFGHHRLAAAWRLLDVFLVALAAAMSAAGGLTGIARATTSTSRVVGSISGVDPVVSGLLAIGASVVAALTFAFAAGKQSSDHATAASEYLKLSTSAADLVTDIPSLTPTKIEDALLRLRRQRDKVLDRFAKMPPNMPSLGWLPWTRWRQSRSSSSLAE
jgi:hypothetical protein